jgi:hypothetical protein
MTVYTTAQKPQATMQKLAGPVTVTDAGARIDLTFNICSRLAFRGVYQSVSLCIYGIVPESTDSKPLIAPGRCECADPCLDEQLPTIAPQELGSRLRRPTQSACDAAAVALSAALEGDLSAFETLTRLFREVTAPLTADMEGFVAGEGEWDSATLLAVSGEATADACLRPITAGTSDEHLDLAIRLACVVLSASASAAAAFAAADGHGALLSVLTSAAPVAVRARAAAALSALGSHAAGARALLEPDAVSRIIAALRQPAAPPVAWRLAVLLRHLSLVAGAAAARTATVDLLQLRDGDDGEAAAAALADALTGASEQLRGFVTDAPLARLTEASADLSGEGGAWGHVGAAPLTQAADPFWQPRLPRGTVRVLHAQRFVHVLAAAAAAPALRAPAVWPRVFAAVRTLMLGLLQTRGGSLLLAAAPGAASALVHALHTASEPLDSPALPYALAHPEDITPSALARLLAAQLRAVAALDVAVRPDDRTPPFYPCSLDLIGVGGRCVAAAAGRAEPCTATRCHAACRCTRADLA